MEADTFEEKYVNPLTGLYFNQAFMQEVDRCIEAVQPGSYCMVAIDVEHFRLFNKIYGRQNGDELLVYIAECIKKIQQQYNVVAGYMGGDNFGVMMPNRMELVETLRDDIITGVHKWSDTVGFLPAIGIYVVEDFVTSPEIMYDRATTALSQVIGKYTNRICIYDSDMEEKLEEELNLLSEIQIALKNKEFTFYAQPQCDISTGKIVGAESLVRWKHGTKGLISPGVFIPVLEKSGFIADLDRYVWKAVCEWLRSWIDRGYHPVPVSINVSRTDIFSMDVPAYLQELLHTYNLPEKLLKVEITESAYAESNQKINETVQKLRDAGFLVMMDDFGSGYSSLNMLKDVAVDVIKLDMRFLDIDDQAEEKGINILQSVVNMARVMGLPIIVEGVETQKQEKFLLNMGCRYTQGYYYYKPLPIENFEELLMDERKLDFDGLWCRQVEELHVGEFLDCNMFSDRMVNNILGPVAFYEMNENQIEIIRVNKQYYQLAGVSTRDSQDYGKKLWNHVRADDRPVLFSIFEQAYGNKNSTGGADGYVHFLRMDGKVLWIYLRVFFLKEKEGRKIFYGALVDMTAMREQKEGKRLSGQKVSELTENQQNRLEKYYGDLPCGYGVARIILDEAGKACDFSCVYANHEMESFSGGNPEMLKTLTWKAFGDRKEEVLKKAYRAAYEGEKVEHFEYSHVSGRYLQFTFYQYEYGYLACMVRDVTHTHIYTDALKSIMYSYREVYYVNLQDNYYRMIYPDENNMMERGNYEEAINRHFGTGKVKKKDEENVRRFLSLRNLREVLKKQDTVEYAYRRSAKGADDEWCLTTFTVSERDEQGIPVIAIIVIRSVDTLVRETEDHRKRHIKETLTTMSEGFFVYRAVDDEKILYANPRVLQIYGCETTEEFQELVKHSFRGMVHPEDLERIEWEINDQIRNSDRKMDYIQYRIIRKDGEVRWIEDYGHLENGSIGDGGGVFYVFISDVTDTITEAQKERLLKRNERYVRSDG